MRDVFSLLVALSVAFVGADSCADVQTRFFAEIPLSTTYANGNMWTGWSGRWADHLLMVNRTAGFPSNTYYRVTTENMLTTLWEMVSYKLDGATFNCDRPSLLDRIDEAKLCGGMPCMFVGSIQPRSFNRALYDYERTRKTFPRNFSNPHGWRAPDGRQIFISYWTDRHHSPEELSDWLRECRKEYGDFLFVPDLSRLGASYWRSRTAEEMKEYVRSYLRVADGIYFGEYIAFQRIENGEVVFDDSRYRDVLIKRLGEVMSEPEFKGKKLLGLVAGLGHGNPYTIGNSIGQDGTRTLRRSFELAMSLKPDFINFFEWDEWNENTLIKPSVWNSFAVKRLFRSLISTARDEANEPLPNDDTSIPNLIVSYRRTLVPGEVGTFEILSVPETGSVGTVSVCLKMTNPQGRIVRSFPPVSLDLSLMQEQRHLWPVEDFSNEAALIPQVSVVSSGRTMDYEKGLPHIEIVPGGSSDHKWAMVSLRDVASHACCSLDVLPTDENGVYVAKVTADSEELIDRAEIEVNHDLVYSRGGVFDDFRMNATQDVFAITAFVKKYTNRNGKSWPRPTLTVEGCDSAEWRFGGETVRGPKLAFVDQCDYTPDAYLRLPRGCGNGVSVTLDWPALGERRTVDLENVRSNGVWAVTGADGFTFAATRFYGFNEYSPSGANKPHLESFALVRADRPVSVLSAYLVTKSGKMFRSIPVVVGNADSPVKRHVYSASVGHPVEVSIGKNRQPPLVYDLSGPDATVVPSGAGCCFDGTLGAIPYIAVHRNRGGASFFHACPENWKDNSSRAPAKAFDGTDVALDFDGSGTFFAIPWGAIPRLASFCLQFDVCPRDVNRDQEIFATGSRAQYGAIGFLKISNGGLIAMICNEAGRNETIALPTVLRPNEWSHVEFEWNGSAAVLTVDGQSSGLVACAGPLRRDAASWFGGRADRFFNGRLRNVRIDYR